MAGVKYFEIRQPSVLPELGDKEIIARLLEKYKVNPKPIKKKK